MSKIQLGTTPNMEIRFWGSNVVNADISSITAVLVDPSGNAATGLTATLIEDNPPRGRHIPSTSTIDEVGPWELQFTVNLASGGVLRSDVVIFDAVANAG